MSGKIVAGRWAVFARLNRRDILDIKKRPDRHFLGCLPGFVFLPSFAPRFFVWYEEFFVLIFASEASEDAFKGPNESDYCHNCENPSKTYELGVVVYSFACSVDSDVKLDIPGDEV